MPQLPKTDLVMEEPDARGHAQAPARGWPTAAVSPQQQQTPQQPARCVPNQVEQGAAAVRQEVAAAKEHLDQGRRAGMAPQVLALLEENYQASQARYLQARSGTLNFRLFLPGVSGTCDAPKYLYR